MTQREAGDAAENENKNEKIGGTIGLNLKTSNQNPEK